MIRLRVVAALLLLAWPALAQARLEQVGWLEGCWEMRRGTTQIIEKWSAPANNQMAGESRTFSRGAERASEKLRLFIRADTLVYESFPSGQRLTEFKTVSAGDAEVVFANPQHDFPQRIVYRRVGADSIVARIEGDRDGRRQPVSFPYAKVVCPAKLEKPQEQTQAVSERSAADYHILQAAHHTSVNFACTTGPRFVASSRGPQWPAITHPRSTFQ